ncbi:MAG: hypothetical protein K6G91_09560 [Kiritimatiellae bacterium]|nr:hypothetical protein [Kiritimatiellia bacterium]
MKAAFSHLQLVVAVCAAGLAFAEPSASGKHEWPFIVIRHTSALSDSSEVFSKLMESHRRHPGVCDEFWFSGGLRLTPEGAAAAAAKIAAFRQLCDEVGVRLSYQQGITLGHGVFHHGSNKPGEQPFPDDAWRMDADGRRFGLLCPRSQFVLDYERDFAKAILRTIRPDSCWLDDDLRLGAWKPQGCFCDRCLAAFNARTGGNWTRQALAKRLFSAAPREPLREMWSSFNAESLAIYAATLRTAVDELGIPCRLGYQAVWADATYNGRDFRPLLESLSGAARHLVGIRPGAGFYVESEPRGMVEKCLSIAREAERCRELEGLVASVCYEQETYPRHVLHKSPGAIMTECALALASGCDSLSLYWYDHAAPEPLEEYERFVRTLAEARPYFERLAASTRRTRLGGVARFVGSAATETPGFDLRDRKDFDLACAGIPVTVAESGVKVWYLTEKSRNEMTETDKAKLAAGSVVKVSDIERYPLASRRTKLLDDLDAATKGTFPVRIDACRPLRILPRVRDDGRLDSVTILNLSIGGTDGLKVRVRRSVSRRALFQEVGMASPSSLPCEDGAFSDEAVVTLSDMPGWRIVTLFFGEDDGELAAPQDMPRHEFR